MHEKSTAHKPHKDQHVHHPAQGIFLEDSPLQDDIQYQDLYQHQNPAAENDAQDAFDGFEILSPVE
jgi:hypothetical protein